MFFEAWRVVKWQECAPTVQTGTAQWATTWYNDVGHTHAQCVQKLFLQVNQFIIFQLSLAVLKCHYAAMTFEMIWIPSKYLSILEHLHASQTTWRIFVKCYQDIHYKPVLGIGRALVLYKGTMVLWMIVDDQGQKYDIRIVDVHYQPNSCCHDRGGHSSRRTHQEPAQPLSVPT
jgi:hypothetical protein